jgi:hypothetical protein
MQFDEGREMRTRTVTVVLYCIAVSARIAQYLTKEITRDENVRLQKMVIYCTQSPAYRKDNRHPMCLFYNWNVW